MSEETKQLIEKLLQKKYNGAIILHCQDGKIKMVEYNIKKPIKE